MHLRNCSACSVKPFVAFNSIREQLPKATLSREGFTSTHIQTYELHSFASRGSSGTERHRGAQLVRLWRRTTLTNKRPLFSTLLRQDGCRQWPAVIDIWKLSDSTQQRWKRPCPLRKLHEIFSAVMFICGVFRWKSFRMTAWRRGVIKRYQSTNRCSKDFLIFRIILTCISKFFYFKS